MLILTPSSYEEIRRTTVSVFDRLEKANYKIDIAGSNTLEEIVDIVLQYIRHHDVTRSFTEEYERDLGAKSGLSMMNSQISAMCAPCSI